MAADLRRLRGQVHVLRPGAEQEGAGAHALSLRAVGEYDSRTAHEALVREAADKQTAAWAELLERLR